MTAIDRDTCCTCSADVGGMKRASVTELFERGYRRNREAPLAIAGARCTGADGNNAVFSLDVTSDTICAVGFRASCCATLIAYCEYIAEFAAGLGLTTARELTAANLVAAVPGVPALKRDRALLAAAGFRAALAAAAEFTIASRLNGQLGEPSDESRLHLRHPAP